MRGVRRPMVFDPFYSSATGTLYPRFTNVVLRNVHSLGSATYHAGELTFAGYGPGNSLGIALDGVVLDGGTPTFATGHNGGLASPSYAEVTEGPGPVSFASTLSSSAGPGVSVSVVPPMSGRVLDCGGAFPSLKTAVPTSPF
jgi:polygalacturonase